MRLKNKLIFFLLSLVLSFSAVSLCYANNVPERPDNPVVDLAGIGSLWLFIIIAIIFIIASIGVDRLFGSSGMGSRRGYWDRIGFGGFGGGGGGFRRGGSLRW
jgi:hypothetical protein